MSLQRIVDAVLEYRIRRATARLRRLVTASNAASDRLKVAALAWTELLQRRSPQQLARMERAAYMRLSPADRQLFDRHVAAQREVDRVLRAASEGVPRTTT